VITEAQVKSILPPRGFIRDYVLWAEGCADSHLVYHLPMALSLLSMVVPIEFYFPFGSELRANLFVLLVGDSTESRKTAAINLAREVLNKAFPAKLMVPPGSPQEFIDSLIETPQQLLVYPEYGEFLEQTKNGNMAEMRTRLTSVYDALPIGRATREKRRLKEAAVCPNPRLSFVGGVAPAFLEDHTTEGDWKGGYLARHLTIFAKRERYLKRPPLDIPGRDHLAETLQKMHAGDVFSAPPSQPCIGMTPAAERLWDEWTELFKNIDAPDLVRAAVSRAESICLKMAILAAWDIGAARSGKPWRLDVPELLLAIRIATLHTKSVGMIAENLAIGRDMRDRRRVLRMINGTPVSLGEILRGAQVTLKRGNDMISTLVAEKTVTRIVQEGSTEPAYVLSGVEPSGLPSKPVNPFA